MTTSALGGVTGATPASILSAATAASTTASSASSSSTSSSSASSTGVGSQAYFLQLLIAQMNNQDPLNPMDSAQVTSQLAQINTVEGIQQVSTQLSTLLSSVAAAQPVQDTALIGKPVLVPGNSLALANGSASAAVNLPQSATQVTVTIDDSNGNPVKTLTLGANAAGNVPFNWDGTTNSGAVATAGNYSFTVAAVSGTSAVTASTLSQGLVTGVVPGTNGASPAISVAGLGTFQMSQVEQIQ